MRSQCTHLPLLWFISHLEESVSPPIAWVQNFRGARLCSSAYIRSTPFLLYSRLVCDALIRPLHCLSVVFLKRHLVQFSRFHCLMITVAFKSKPRGSSYYANLYPSARKIQTPSVQRIIPTSAFIHHGICKDYHRKLRAPCSPRCPPLDLQCQRNPNSPFRHQYHRHHQQRKC